MIYRTKHGKEVIARVIDTFDIEYSDWIARSPLWLQDGLSDLNIVIGYENATEDFTITDYTIQLPCDLKLLDYIVYDGNALRCVNFNLLQFPAQVEASDGNRYVYALDRQGNAKFGFDDEDVTVNYRRLPVDYDNVYKSYFPRVPDDDKVMHALTYYLLLRMMQRGYKHKVYSLESNSPATNIYMLYQQEAKRARNSVSDFDPAERDEISKLMRSLLVSPNFRNDEMFDNRLITYT